MAYGSRRGGRNKPKPSANPTHYNALDLIEPPVGDESIIDKHRTLSRVYFALDVAAGEVKIGYSANVTARIKRIRWEYGRAVELLGTTDGGLEFETLLHRRFAPYRRRGEWFSAEILPELKAILDADQDWYGDRVAA